MRADTEKWVTELAGALDYLAKNGSVRDRALALNAIDFAQKEEHVVGRKKRRVFRGDAVTLSDCWGGSVLIWLLGVSISIWWATLAIFLRLGNSRCR